MSGKRIPVTRAVRIGWPFRRGSHGPAGQPERDQRAIAVAAQAIAEVFGSCTNMGECEAVCPKEIKLEVFARMNRDFLVGSLLGR